jgi:hypothetical protein
MAGNFLFHCVAIRYRVVGSGNLKSTLFSLDAVQSQVLPDVPMSLTTERYPNLLSNMIQQRFGLEFGVDAMDDSFIIRQIQFYIKPVSTGYPQ